MEKFQLIGQPFPGIDSRRLSKLSIGHLAERDISLADNDYSDDSDYQQTARDISGDSDSQDDEVFKGFPIQVPEDVNWTLRGPLVQEQDEMHIYDQPRLGPTVNMDGNTCLINIIHYFY